MPPPSVQRALLSPNCLSQLRTVLPAVLPHVECRQRAEPAKHEPATPLRRWAGDREDRKGFSPPALRLTNAESPRDHSRCRFGEGRLTSGGTDARWALCQTSIRRGPTKEEQHVSCHVAMNPILRIMSCARGREAVDSRNRENERAAIRACAANYPAMRTDRPPRAVRFGSSLPSSTLRHRRAAPCATGRKDPGSGTDRPFRGTHPRRRGRLRCPLCLGDRELPAGAAFAP